MHLVNFLWVSVCVFWFKAASDSQHIKNMSERNPVVHKWNLSDCGQQSVPCQIIQFRFALFFFRLNTLGNLSSTNENCITNTVLYIHASAGQQYKNCSLHFTHLDMPKCIVEFKSIVMKELMLIIWPYRGFISDEELTEMSVNCIMDIWMTSCKCATFHLAVDKNCIRKHIGNFKIFKILK